METPNEEIKTVDDCFRSNRRPPEAINKDAIKKLNWVYSDVLYSFKGVYTLGILAFYGKNGKHNISQCGKTIKAGTNQKVYSGKYLASNYKKFEELNELEELNKFITNYNCLGNVCPTWPGGNEHRGKSQCYDIPDIYFKRHELWYNELVRQNPNAVLEAVSRSIYNDPVDKFLDSIKMEEGYYEDFLRHVNMVINNRDECLRAEIV